MLKNCLVSLHFQLFMWERMVKTDLSKIKSLHRNVLDLKQFLLEEKRIGVFNFQILKVILT